MIRVRLLGHIKTAVGAEVVDLERQSIGPADLVEEIRGMSKATDPGFTKHNVLLMIENGEAFVPARDGREIPDGANLVLIPFSHGG